MFPQFNCDKFKLYVKVALVQSDYEILWSSVYHVQETSENTTFDLTCLGICRILSELSLGYLMSAVILRINKNA